MMPFYTLLVAIYILVALIVIYHFWGKSILQDCAIKSAYKLLIKSHSQSSLDADIIYSVYNQLFKNGYDIIYMDFLECFLIYIHEKDLNKEQIISLTGIISPILQKAKEEEPYAHLDEREKHLLIEIEKTAKIGETMSLKTHLTDISDILFRKQKNLVDSNKRNTWALVISIIGLVLSLVGLIISIINH